MKQPCISAGCGWLMGTVFIGLLGSTTIALAEADAFVKDEYYLGAGGTPPTLAEMAAEPLTYFRSVYAYESFRNQMAAVLKVNEVTDADFRLLLVSERVELRPCSDQPSGQILTAGIINDSVQTQSVRGCYPNEYLIWIDVDEVILVEDWQLVGSQGCFNASWPYTPPPPKLTPTPEPVPQRAETVYLPGMSLEVDMICPCGCCIPGTSVRVPGGIQRNVPGFGQD